MARTLRDWAKYRTPNVVLLMSSIVYLILCGASVYLGTYSLREHVDDLTDNPSIKHVGQCAECAADAESCPACETRPVPCGLPTPDMIYLLHSVGEYNEATQFLTASYSGDNGWYQRMHGALCGLNYVEWENADANDDGIIDGSTKPDGSAYQLPEDYDADGYNRARYSYMIATLMDDNDMHPPITSTDKFATAKTKIDEAMCDEATKTRIYSKRQQKVYGEWRERIARAYVTAAPAFYRYQSWLEAQGGQIDANDANDLAPDADSGCFAGLPAWKRPFLLADSSEGAADRCMNYNLIKDVLERAGSPASLARLAGNTEDLPDAQEMFVALMALSVIGYVDRTENHGQCMRYGVDPDDPDKDRSAHLFCTGIVGNDVRAPLSSDLADLTDTPMEAYASLVQTAADGQSCANIAAAPPPSAAPPMTRGDPSGTTVKDMVTDVCAELLQFGLFNQEKLFGVQDPVSEFAVDARPEVGGHIVAQPLIEGLFLNPIGHTRFHNRVWRLEAYMAYRLAMTAFWGTVLGTVIGYFAGRAFVPLVIQIGAQIGLIKDKDGTTTQLVRPGTEWPLFVAALAGIATGWWLIFVDPGTQSHYPITTSCTDWAYDGPHPTSGPYVTTWTRPRNTRLPPAALGPIVGAVSVFPLFIFVFNAATGFRKRKKEAQDADADGDEPKSYLPKMDTVIPALLLLFNIGVLAFFALQAQETGQAWLSRAKTGKSTTEINERYGADCMSAVYAGFWIGGCYGWVRSRWVLNGVGGQWTILWLVGAVVLAIMPFVQARALIGEDIYDNSLSEDPDDTVRRTYLIGALAFTLLALILIGWLGYSAYKNRPPVDSIGATQAEVANEKEQVITDAPFLSPEVRRLMDMKVLEPMPVHDATGTTGSTALSSRAYGAFRLRSGAQYPRYQPMLRVTSQL